MYNENPVTRYKTELKQRLDSSDFSHTSSIDFSETPKNSTIKNHRSTMLAELAGNKLLDSEEDPSERTFNCSYCEIKAHYKCTCKFPAIYLCKEHLKSHNELCMKLKLPIFSLKQVTEHSRRYQETIQDLTEPVKPFEPNSERINYVKLSYIDLNEALKNFNSCRELPDENMQSSGDSVVIEEPPGILPAYETPEDSVVIKDNSSDQEVPEILYTSKSSSKQTLSSQETLQKFMSCFNELKEHQVQIYYKPSVFKKLFCCFKSQSNLTHSQKEAASKLMSLSSFSQQRSLDVFMLKSVHELLTFNQEFNFESKFVTSLKSKGSVFLYLMFYLGWNFPEHFKRVREHYLANQDQYSLTEVGYLFSNLTFELFRKRQLDSAINYTESVLETLGIFFSGVLLFWFTQYCSSPKKDLNSLNKYVLKHAKNQTLDCFLRAFKIFKETNKRTQLP